ncbi:MAG TPA: hypothetical protein VND90_11450 [Terracidiphilus sp.]|nr:hypothetical protein [Terracidiphilus sp.]
MRAVLPNGRVIAPEGAWIPVAPYPFALAARPDGAQMAVPSIGFPFALNVVDGPESAEPRVHRMPAGEKNDAAVEVQAGLAYSPDGKLLYVATGDSGQVRAYRTSDWTVAGDVPLDGVMAEGKIPALIVIRLPNDHTADPRPEDGYPYRASYVADNDLALG